MAYDLKKLDSVILEECYHCHSTGTEPDYSDGGDPAEGTKTCHICDGEGKIASKEIWSIDQESL